MAAPALVQIADADACVEAVLSRVGRRIVLGLPVGIGKPNLLANAFVQRAAAEPSIRLTIVTALSLSAPRGTSDLERRLVEPLAQRLFGDYPELDYARLLSERRLPPNIEVIEFYLEPGAWLANDALQQSYLSANYTHVLRDAVARGLNVVAQLVAPPPPGEAAPGMLSLGSNADLTADLLPRLEALRTAGRPVVLVGQWNRELPFMYGDALAPESAFDFLVDEPARPVALYGPPNLPVGLTEHAIALSVSTLIRDGGTLQLGIGELGDAITAATLLRHRRNALYREAVAASGVLGRSGPLIETEGGLAAFERGLYGCSEMLVDGFLDLYRAGVLKRRVYPSARLQRLLDAGAIDEQPDCWTLERLAAAGLNDLQPQELAELRAGGVLVDAGFFLGPRAFYAALRDLPATERRRFAMRGIAWVNELYGDAAELKVAQRRHARFINTTMIVTGLGAAVSDGLADGRVVSGVGGQYNFVAMAHALPEARSILCLRSTREAQGRRTSNIVWSYGHATIPRHLRDIVVTEYGIADLRGRTDREIVAALIEVMDSEFQESFVADAMRAGKLPRAYRIPETARSNRGEALRARLGPMRAKGAFPELPFGSELTSEEIALTPALRRLGSGLATWRGRLAILRRAIAADVEDAALAPLLARLNLARPVGLRERVERRLVAAALPPSG